MPALPFLIVLLSSTFAVAQDHQDHEAHCGFAECTMPEVLILGSRIEGRPEGRVHGEVPRRELESTDPFSLRDVMDSVPGVLVKQSNGPRDVGISLRGSGAKVGFGVRNIKVYEDWFPTTQSDGLSRTDLHDPNAYDGVDVFRGPSSALYDNYALGGVVNFRTRRGRDLDGVDVGAVGGSYGYQNYFVHAGGETAKLEHSLFGSLIRGDGYIDHSGFTTVTENFLVEYRPDDERRVTFKFLNNDVKSQVPSRLTWNELNADHRDAGLTNVTGVGVVSAEQAAQGRRDRRTIVGARYEQSFSQGTSMRFLGAYDVKDINQTFGTIGDNTNPNFQQYADVAHEGELFGLKSKAMGGVFFNYMEQEATSFRNLADFEGSRGALQSNTRGHHQNLGLRGREELSLSDRFLLVAGAGVERSDVRATAQTRTAAETYSRVNVDRKFYNAAPELALVHKAGELENHARVAMGYGIPGISQLTTTPDGLSGNNTGLKPQRNLGFELGSAGRAASWFSYDAALYYELFYDEFVTKSPGAGLASFTDNAPRSTHRGAELWAEARHSAGPFVSAAYTWNDHRYASFVEGIGGGVFLNRKGNKIPGVEEHSANAKVGFEPEGLPGGWLEAAHVGGYYLNNSNTLRTRPWTVLNVNVHWTWERRGKAVSRVTFFADARNLADLVYQGSAVVVADAPTDTPALLNSSKQAFFAGQGRTFSAGVRARF